MAIRIAVAADIKELAAVHVRSWQQTYGGHFPQEFLDGLDPEQRAVGYRHRFLDAPESRRALLVSSIDDAIAGFINVGPCRDDGRSQDGEVRACYLLAEFWGRGLGRELMSAGLEFLGFPIREVRYSTRL